MKNIKLYLFKGSKEVNLLYTGSEKQIVTVELGIAANGEKLQPYVIFKGKKKINKSKFNIF